MSMEQRRKNWNYAIGMAMIDGVKPSDELFKLAQKQIKGEITTKEITKKMIENHTKKE